MIIRIILCILSGLFSAMLADMIFLAGTYMNKLEVSKKDGHLISLPLGFFCGFLGSFLPVYGLYALLAFLVMFIEHKVLFPSRGLMVQLFDVGYFVFNIIVGQIVFQTIYQIFVPGTIEKIFHQDVHRAGIMAGTTFLLVIVMIVSRFMLPFDNFRLMYDVPVFMRQVTTVVYSMMAVSVFLLAIVYKMPYVLFENAAILVGIALFYLAYAVSINFVIRETVTLNRHVSELDEQLKRQNQSFNKQAKYVEDLQKVRSIYSTHIDTINKSLDEGNIESAKEHLQAIREDIKNISTHYTMFSNNAYIDAIVNEAQYNCDVKGITISGEITINGKISLTEQELTTVLANTLRNAIEACEKPGVENPMIRLQSTENGGWVSIVIENSYDGNIIMKDGEFATTKTSNAELHGKGLSEVRTIVDAYKGLLSIVPDPDKNIFSVNITLPCPE